MYLIFQLLDFQNPLDFGVNNGQNQRDSTLSLIVNSQNRCLSVTACFAFCLLLEAENHYENGGPKIKKKAYLTNRAFLRGFLKHPLKWFLEIELLLTFYFTFLSFSL